MTMSIPLFKPDAATPEGYTPFAVFYGELEALIPSLKWERQNLQTSDHLA
jgi:hypothetical protein